MIVGAGVAGCLAAETIARAGFDACLLDLKPADRIGEKVCGDAVSKAWFDKLKLGYPSGEELAQVVESLEIVSPDGTVRFKIGGQAFILRRKEFGQRLLRRALDFGAHLLDKALAFDHLIKNKFVCGVRARAQGKLTEIEAAITINAAGALSILKPPTILGFEPMKPDDAIVCYREIRRLKSPCEISACLVVLNQEISPRGYSWIFPHGMRELNVGLGTSYDYNPRALFYEGLVNLDPVRDSDPVESGGWIVPVRRPLEPLVANGYAVVGDAAFTTSPLHGGGIGPSMLSGKLAGEVAVEALELENTSQSALWRYPKDYARRYGAKQAALEIFRRFLQSLSNDELNFGMRKRLLDEQEVLQASSEGRVEMSFVTKLRKLAWGLRKLGLLRRLSSTARFMDILRHHYLKYPNSPKAFPAWRRELELTLQRAVNAIARR